MLQASIKAECIFSTTDQGLAAFGPILQSGFKMNVQTGVSIKDLLCQQFAVDPAYVEDRIRTAFLDGKPVDDFSTTSIENNASLALSAAMPGLVGATFRKGGYLAALRGTITHRSMGKPVEGRPGVVTFKLFNLLAKEIGLPFLKHGVIIDGQTALAFLSNPPDAFQRGCLEILMDGNTIRTDRLLEMIPSATQEFVELRLKRNKLHGC